MSDFSRLLQQRLATIGQTAADLAKASGLSRAVISRYLRGERTPPASGKSLQQLANGLATLSETSEEEELASLRQAIAGIDGDCESTITNLELLIDALGINRNELARALNFDPSYISRIFSGERHPADMHVFLSDTARFIARRASRTSQADIIASVCNCSPADIENEASCVQAILEWLGSSVVPANDNLSNFLKKLDEFNLDDFIRAIHFDDLRLPTAPFQLPTTKTYRTLDEMMNCELDFLRATVLSKSTEDVIMYSDMPLEEMAANEQFSKKWMFGMAAMLKRGLHLRMIHDTNRPLPEMMLGLEGWIPMYMTGQISPYYLANSQCDTFCHLLKVSGTVAMQGEAIAGYQSEGRYVLTKNREEVRYLRRRAERLLKHARPLMRIITAANANDLKVFRDSEANDKGPVRFVFGTLPLGGMPEEVLERILARYNFDPETAHAIRSLRDEHTKQLLRIMEADNASIEVPGISQQEFDEHPLRLDVSDLFLDQVPFYSYQEYAEHLDALRALTAEHPSCELTVDEHATFRNLQISIRAGRSVHVAKSSNPVIHFVIEHPKLVDAFAHYDTPIRD